MRHGMLRISATEQSSRIPALYELRNLALQPVCNFVRSCSAYSVAIHVEICDIFAYLMWSLASCNDQGSGYEGRRQQGGYGGYGGSEESGYGGGEGGYGGYGGSEEGGYGYRQQQASLRSRSKEIPVAMLTQILSERTGHKVDIGNIRTTIFDMFGDQASPTVKMFVNVVLQQLQVSLRLTFLPLICVPANFPHVVFTCNRCQIAALMGPLSELDSPLLPCQEDLAKESKQWIHIMTNVKYCGPMARVQFCD